MAEDFKLQSLYSLVVDIPLFPPVEEFVCQRSSFFHRVDDGQPKLGLSIVGPYLAEALEKQKQRLISRNIKMDAEEWLPDQYADKQYKFANANAFEIGQEVVYHVRYFSTDIRRYHLQNHKPSFIRKGLWHDYYLKKINEEEYFISSIDVADKFDCLYKRVTEYCKEKYLKLQVTPGLPILIIQKGMRMASRSISNRICQQIPDFALEQFIAQASGQLKCIYFAKNQESVETFVYGDLKKFIEKHQNVVNCELMNFYFIDFCSDGQNYTISARLKVMLDRVVGGRRVWRKKEIIKICFVRPIDGIMNQDWYVKKIVTLNKGL